MRGPVEKQDGIFSLRCPGKAGASGTIRCAKTAVGRSGAERDVAAVWAALGAGRPSIAPDRLLRASAVADVLLDPKPAIVDRTAGLQLAVPVVRQMSIDEQVGTHGVHEESLSVDEALGADSFFSAYCSWLRDGG